MATYPNIEIGDLVTADLLDSMLPKTHSKATSTTRNNTASLANDDELTGIALGVGTWDITLNAFWTCASTTPKIKTRGGFTGTWTTATRTCLGPGNAQVAGPEAVTEATFRGYTTDTQDAVYSTSTSVAYSTFVEICRNVVVTVAGTLSLQWAQSTANASNTVMQAGSSFVVRQAA